MKAGTEGGVELGMESIQFGAPSSAGSTDSDGVPALLEKTSDNKLPEPKEQRQKQPRAGPVKPQKVVPAFISKDQCAAFASHNTAYFQMKRDIYQDAAKDFIVVWMRSGL